MDALDRPLDSLGFDNRFTSSLPADSDQSNRRRQVHGAAFSRVEPTAVTAAVTLATSSSVAKLLGLPQAVLESTDFADVFGGNRIPVGADPFAACYGGHQFGNWAGQLGDGRAIALGEVVDRNGNHQTLQLKGAGPTPYSRTADGRAVLRSSIREFLCSEAMFHLGVPTTRALSLVSTGDRVVRDMLYDGHPQAEPGAVVCRVAPSFTRFGTFQLPASRDDVTLLKGLVDFTIETDFPQIDEERFATTGERLGRWLTEVCRRSAELVVHWMRVGFVHGVLNTDNMSILGLTIDYGPYGWLETFDPDWTPNTTDAANRRYRFGTQPEVVHWNLVQLAKALLPLIDDVAPLQAALDTYRTAYDQGFAEMMAERLGFGAYRSDDDELFTELFDVLQRTETDYVIFFRDLADVRVCQPDVVSDDELLAPLSDAWYRPADLEADNGEVRSAIVGWLRAWSARVRDGGLDNEERRRRMDMVNPRYVLRNYLAQEAIDAAEAGDLGLLVELQRVLQRPYVDQPGRDRFAAKRPEWARHRVGCSMLSCSS